ncbi:CPBP family intramembrane metalloprotease [Pseudonocardiaceae bacterium YIM PH 21723]|nr:CPBP family intramembrane metalloprotease [Pseudonocardiaceae bacterium YIM PH 21723]
MALAVGWRRVWLVLEFAVLFVGAPVLYWLVKVPGGPIPLLILLAVAAVFYLRAQPGFDRRNFGGLSKVRGELRNMLLIAALGAAVAVAVLAFFLPDLLFNLPRRSQVMWIAIMVLYPLFSVYPQELVFRGFLFQRYAPLFGNRGIVAASAVAFGFVHIIFGNLLAVVMTLFGGYLFASRYQRTGALLVPAVEHAIYGCLIFTVGLGQFFYHGAALR